MALFHTTAREAQAVIERAGSPSDIKAALRRLNINKLLGEDSDDQSKMDEDDEHLKQLSRSLSEIRHELRALQAVPLRIKDDNFQAQRAEALRLINSVVHHSNNVQEGLRRIIQHELSIYKDLKGL